VHERLVRIGIKLKGSLFTEEEIALIKLEYLLYRYMGKLLEEFKK